MEMTFLSATLFHSWLRLNNRVRQAQSTTIHVTSRAHVDRPSRLGRPQILIARLAIAFLSVAWALPTCCADQAVSFLEDRVKKDPDDFVAQNQLASRYLELLRTSGDTAWLEKARQAANASVRVGLPELNTGGIHIL